MTAQFVHSTNVSGTKRQHASPYAGIYRRGLVVALVLGSVLTVLNQSGALFGDGTIQYSQMALVYLIPFIVVSVSQYLGIRRALTDAADAAGTGISRPEGEHPFATAFHHGIPARAAIVSLIMGSLAVGVVLLSGSNGIGDLPVALTAQGYILPALFGMLSQTIAYRRASHMLRKT